MPIELLAPAGNLKKAKIAILYGADAVYIGGQEFSLRSRASNFSIEEIAELCRFAHEHGSKVHVTVNIIPHPDDFDGLEDYLRALDAAGIDAIISASPGILSTALAMDRHFEVHVSTQRSILNEAAVRFWKEQGADRVVLGRECGMEAIRTIAQKNIVPIEAFIHGGMCISFSGRCVLSNHMTERDANRGGCAQSCRWKYELSTPEGILSDAAVPYSMSSRDLQAADQIQAMIEAGVASLKIEGRMKSDYYLAVVVGAYRRLIDAIEAGHPVDDTMIRKTAAELARAENRPAGPGFYHGLPDEHVQLYRRHDENVTQEYIAQVVDCSRPGWIRAVVKNNFSRGEAVELFGPGIAPVAGTLDEIRDENGFSLAVCPHPMQIVWLKWDGPAALFSMIRKQRAHGSSKGSASAGNCDYTE